MDLLCAIDIRGGGAVRLTQGDFAREHAYGDPLDLAGRFITAGARWLHVVDLDAARQGRPVNRSTVLAIAATAATAGVSVETGGGVRSMADVEELLAGGVTRVVFGTAALEDPQLVRAAAADHPGRVAVGIDYRLSDDGATEVAVRGWEQGGGVTVAAALRQFDGVDIAAVIVTAIERDGMLTGPDLEGLARVLGATSVPVIASGGVGSVADIEALAELSVPVGPDAGRSVGGRTASGSARTLAGVITGKALVDGRLDIDEGMAACRPSG